MSKITQEDHDKALEMLRQGMSLRNIAVTADERCMYTSWKSEKPPKSRLRLRIVWMMIRIAT